MIRPAFDRDRRCSSRRSSLYAVFLLATRAGVLDAESWPLAASRWLWPSSRCCWWSAASSIFAQFLRRAAGLDLCAGAYRGRQIRAGAGTLMTRRRTHRAQAHRRRLARRAGSLPRLLGVLDRDGEEARVVGGAVRNALLGLPVARNRRRHHRGAGRSGAARRGGRLQGGADRHRARHHHGRDRQGAVRGDDAAPGRRDLRPPRQGRLRPRLADRRRAARLHHQRALARRATAPSTIMSAGSPILTRAACASSAIRRQRIAEDYLRILRFFRFHAAYGTGAPGSAGLARLHRRARRARAIVARARAHGD